MDFAHLNIHHKVFFMQTCVRKYFQEAMHHNYYTALVWDSHMAEILHALQHRDIVRAECALNSMLLLSYAPKITIQQMVDALY